MSDVDVLQAIVPYFPFHVDDQMTETGMFFSLKPLLAVGRAKRKHEEILPRFMTELLLWWHCRKARQKKYGVRVTSKGFLDRVSRAYGVKHGRSEQGMFHSVLSCVHNHLQGLFLDLIMKLNEAGKGLPKCHEPSHVVKDRDTEDYKNPFAYGGSLETNLHVELAPNGESRRDAQRCKNKMGVHSFESVQ